MHAIPVDQQATPSQRGTRILAVMAADVVDYTRLTEVAELENAHPIAFAAGRNH
jgi:class 3 adenylate cyclase